MQLFRLVSCKHTPICLVDVGSCAFISIIRLFALFSAVAIRSATHFGFGFTTFITKLPDTRLKYYDHALRRPLGSRDML